MARIVDLDKLVPEDIEFAYRGEKYLLPGDIDVEHTFKLIRLWEAGVEAETDGALDQREKANLAIEAALTELFRIRDENLERLPFGAASLRVILGEVLLLLGLEITETPPEPRPRKQAIPRSRRSRGSQKS